jgi:hypothetical protein
MYDGLSWTGAEMEAQMDLDLRSIADQLTDDTPERAAMSMAQLFDLALDSLAGTHRRDGFLTAFKREMARRGYRLLPGPRLIPFARLQIGDRFQTADQKRYRKIAAMVIQQDPQNPLRYNAYDLQTGDLVSIAETEWVEKIERE